MTEAVEHPALRALPRRLFTRRFLAGGAATAALGPVTAAAGPTTPAAADGRRAAAAGEVKHLKLYAEKLADGRRGYGLEKGKASVPGPLVELVEGDTLHIEFENTMEVEASLHVHGLDYDVASDGTKMSHSSVEPGGTRTYTWRTHAPGRRKDGSWRPGSAGYWHYHDHAVGTEHGTGGIRAGMYGPVVVRRAGDPLPDRQFTIVFNDMTINNLPAGPDFRATVGERIEIIMITHGEYYHTFHVHGHRWADNRTGLLEGPDDPSRVIDTKITGPADSFGFQVVAGEGVGAGAWMYHCHVQSHSDMGMAGLLLIAKPDGTIPGHDGHGGHAGSRPG
ncbi:multicopper oxidase domain-containing protein [Streptomyces hygroscopicus]|uniref:multicopper oxidase domain-containing protein n=1 Tax=Streptomyces hygroscopicus TaxID=1912 RepID=UPI001FCBF1C8|nr:multicopper oxidase domain-containing protein [Streptomyces hygroscopicus]BDH13766.1 copper oxidase [Streptomyces hygroscopicus]